MNILALHNAIAAIAPIDGVSSDGRIDFRPEATAEQRAAAQEIMENWVDPFEADFSGFARVAQFGEDGGPRPYWEELELEAIAASPVGYYFGQIQNNVMSLQSVPKLIQRLQQIKGVTGFEFSPAAAVALDADMQQYIDPTFTWATLPTA